MITIRTIKNNKYHHHNYHHYHYHSFILDATSQASIDEKDIRVDLDDSRELDLMNNLPTPSPSNNDDYNIRFNDNIVGLNNNNKDRNYLRNRVYDSNNKTPKKSPKKDKPPKKSPKTLFKNDGNKFARNSISPTNYKTSKTFSVTRNPLRPTRSPSASPSSKSSKPTPSPVKRQ